MTIYRFDRVLRFFAILSLVLAIAAVLVVVILADRESDHYHKFECTVDRVEGTFLTDRFFLRSRSPMVTMFRHDNGQERSFMFPAERVQCAERTNG